MAVVRRAQHHGAPPAYWSGATEVLRTLLSWLLRHNASGLRLQLLSMQLTARCLLAAKCTHGEPLQEALQLVYAPKRLGWTTENPFTEAFGPRWADFASGVEKQMGSCSRGVQIGGVWRSIDPYVWVRMLVQRGETQHEVLVLREVAALAFGPSFVSLHASRVAPALAASIFGPPAGETMVSVGGIERVPLWLVDSAPEFEDLRRELSEAQQASGDSRLVVEDEEAQANADELAALSRLEPEPVAKGRLSMVGEPEEEEEAAAEVARLLEAAHRRAALMFPDNT